MAETDKEVARRAFALLMAYLPEPMACDEFPQRNSLGLASGRGLWGFSAAAQTTAQHAFSPYSSAGIDFARPAGIEEAVDPRQVRKTRQIAFFLPWIVSLELLSAIGDFL